jgi:hypothetical protein
MKPQEGFYAFVDASKPIARSRFIKSMVSFFQSGSFWGFL